MNELHRLLRARSVAIVGASDKNPWSAHVLRSLEAIGFRGPVHLVNRRGTAALGRQTVQSCTLIKDVDAAFVAVPAAALLDAIEDMAAGGIRYGVVVSSGFAELGRAGALEQARIFARARDLGVMLLGPNSLGFSNFVDRVSLGAIPLKLPLLDHPRVGLVSQSGATAAMIYAVAHQQNVSLSYSIAMGNEADVDLAHVIEFFVADESTRAIAVFAETIRKPSAFERAARAAIAARKPIIMLKVGAGELTATVAQAHTGALVGDDRVFQAVCDALNIVRVSSLEDLVITADVLAAIGPIEPRKGFALVSISGGACEIVADRGEECGVPLPQFSAETRERLAGVLPEFGASHNPLDVTGAALREPKIYSAAMSVIGADPGVGLLGVIAELPASGGASSPGTDATLAEIAAGFRAIGLPGIVIQQTFKPIEDVGRQAIDRHQLPVVTGGLDHVVRALGHLYSWSRGCHRGCPPVRAAESATVDRPETERALLDYLGRAGVPVIPQHLANTRSAAVAFAREIGYPVVLKVLSPQIKHKTEVGGVLLNLSGDDAVGHGYDCIIRGVAAASPGAQIEGIVVSPMRLGGVELIVGVARDPLWGLALAVGLGGVWVELLADTSVRVLPVTAADARAMLEELRAAKLLGGYRGSKPADLERLSEVIAAIGDAALALGGDLDALEVNPLRADGAHIEALDALAVWRPA